MLSFRNTVLIVLFGIALAGQAWADGAVIQVKGMVCAFCSQGLTKKFGAEAAVEKVNVNLDNKLVQLGFKTGQSLTDGRIKELIEDAGFSIVKITRE